MSKYELMFISKLIGDDELNSIIEDLKTVVNENGKVNKVDIWGVKMLAYDIAGNQKGIYVLLTFDGNPTCICNVDHKLKINENILRHMIIKKCA